ncbi:MAG: peptidase C11 [Clostridia bacterium]|nr:peptidase C11 [Clostridia bacterium]
MDEQRKPRSREKKVVNEGKGVEKRGEGLGTGPVNNTGSYEDRRQQQNASQASPFGGMQQRPSSGQSASSRPVQQYPFGQQRPAQRRDESGLPFGQGGQPSGSQNPFGASGRPSGGAANPFGTRPVSGQSNPFGARPSSGSNAGGQGQYHFGVKQNSTGTQRASGSGSGMGGGKLLLIIAALVLLLGGGGLSGLFGGESGDSTVSNVLNTVTQTGGTTSNSASSSGSGMDIGNLLSSLMGAGSTAYDYSGSAGSLLSGMTGTGTVSNQNSAVPYFTSSGDNNSTALDETVSSKARAKFTEIAGNKQDEVTIMVYMCGTDLESQQGMATSDLKEMAAATVGDKINLIVFTGGCRRWRNNVVSSSVNQIYQIKNGQFLCLEKDMGSGSMVNPDTLTTFIKYGKKNFPANRMCLIFWDHGGGSVSGFGYDEKVGHNQSMTLAGINSALKKADVKFDFIGFDACLMATVENGIMLSQYADYMIASEETEPGVGWYYTNWLNNLNKNTSMPTIQIGKQIADDFVEVCNRQCRGQATTLSVVDLAELQATVPDELKQFSIDTNELIQNKEYKTVSKARSKTREFAQSSRIDQIDMVDFAKNMGTSGGKTLAKALQNAVKYNRTGGSISHAYGLSIYFPYQRANKVKQMVSTYQAIGMDEEYTRCIQEFASLEVSGQVSAGTSLNNYGSGAYASQDLLGSLLGQGGGYSSSYSTGGLTELLGGLYGGGSSSGSTGSILDLFMGRNMTAENAAAYIMDNHFDASQLVWQDGKITLDKDQWDLVTSLLMNVFYNDGTGFIDLGMDTTYETEGNSLLSEYDGTWLSINRQPVAYYYLNTVEDGDNYVISGYVPALLNGEQVDLILNFDSEHEGDGYIAGALKKYKDDESDTQAKELIAIGKGDVLQFLCDYFDYEGVYRDTYKLGDPITLGETVEIANTPIDRSRCQVTFRLTDIYQQNYWTPAIR